MNGMVEPMKQSRRERAVWGWMLTMTGLLLAVLAGVQGDRAQRIVTVQAWQVTTTTVTETVVCAGTLRTVKGASVVSEVPCVVKTVEVAVGDAVKAGDVLLTVDREATLSKAAGLGWTSPQAQAAASALPETVTAPTGGTVTAVHVKTGDWLSTTAPCVSLADQGDLEVAITVNESALPEVKVGQSVCVSGVAFAKSSYDGTLTALSSTARAAVGTSGTRTVLDGVVTLDPSQMDPSLLSGLSAKAVITVDARERAIVVPYEAVCEREGTHAVVYCLHGSNAFRRAVTVAGETAKGIEIASGLQTGEWIVADVSEIDGEETAVTVEAIACRS